MTAIIKIRFVKSSALSSDAIAWHEGLSMPFPPSHAECESIDGKFWLGQHGESFQGIPAGMQARPAGYDHDQVAIMPDGRRCEIIVPIPVTQAQSDAFYAYMNASIGQPYDWAAIPGYEFSGHHHTVGNAICSAKMMAGLRIVNYFPWPTTIPFHLVDPATLMFALSTHVKIDH